MKKILFSISIIFLLAAGCNSQKNSTTQSESSSDNQGLQTSSQQNQETDIQFTDPSFITSKGFLVPTNPTDPAFGDLEFMTGFIHAADYYPDDHTAVFGYVSTTKPLDLISIRETDNSQAGLNKMQTFLKVACLQNLSDIGNQPMVTFCPAHPLNKSVYFNKNSYDVIFTTTAPVSDDVLKSIAQSFK